jgi:hypothetical protein
MAHRTLPSPQLFFLVALWVFGSCTPNVYRVLGPGTTRAQVARLKQVDTKAAADYTAALQRRGNEPGPTPQQVLDSAVAARQHLLTPEQHQRYRDYFYHSPLPLRYPKRAPRHQQ